MAFWELYDTLNITGEGFVSSLFGFGLVMIIPPFFRISLSHPAK